MQQSAEKFKTTIAKALGRRNFETHTNAYRLLNGAADNAPGFTLDKFDDVLVLSLYEQPNKLNLSETNLIETIAETCNPKSIYLKRRPREAKHIANTQRDYLASLAPVWGEAKSELIVIENNVQYTIRPGGDLSVGLFLDMRDARAWLKNIVFGKTVLNCFAYTCAFGVVANLAGATRTLNLDLSRKVLDWGEENYRLNGLATNRQDFLSGDVFDWLQRFAKRNQQFEIVILDPPSFARSQTLKFSAMQHYADLVALAAKVVAPNGVLLACCNLAGLPVAQFLREVQAGLKTVGRKAELLTQIFQPEDFPILFDNEAPLKVFVFRLN